MLTAGAVNTWPDIKPMPSDRMSVLANSIYFTVMIFLKFVIMRMNNVIPKYRSGIK